MTIDPLNPPKARSLAQAEDVDPKFDIDTATPEEAAQMAHLLHTLQLMQARGEELPEKYNRLATGAECFVEYVMVDEASGAQLINGEHHVDWQRFFDRNAFGVILAPVGHGKTQQIAIGRILYSLGKNPSRRIGVICEVVSQAEDRVGLIAQHILSNARLHEVFPDLKPSGDPRDSWSSSEITVERETNAKDPSVRAFGAGSSDIQGTRLDEIYLDDVLSEKSTRTPEARAKILHWFDTKVFTRLPPTGNGRILVIGTPWHSEDLLHVLAARRDWGSQVWSAVLNPDDPQSAWEALWPEVVSAGQLRFIYANMLPNAFNRKYCCRARNDETARFKKEWIELSLRNGRGLRFCARQPTTGFAGDLLPCFTGVDLGVGQKEHHDLSVILTVALHPNGRRQIVDVQSGRWTGPDIVQRIVRTQRRFDSTVMVESNAAQDYIRQFTIGEGVPVLPFFTGRNKRDESFGVETLAVEMRAGLWKFPSNELGEADEDEIRALIRGMLDYVPTEHTADHIMAMWFAREAIRAFEGRKLSTSATVDLQYR